MGAAAEDLRVYQPTERARAIASGALKVTPETPQNVVLYSHYASICSQRARLVLVEKQVPFTGVMLHYDKFETLTPTYLGLNPRGVVPTIVADGEVVFDSATIMQYVNNRYVGPDLTPGDDAQKALIKKEIETADFFPIRDMVFRIGKDRASHGATYSGWGAGMIPKYIATMQEFKSRYPAFSDSYEQKLKDWSDQIQRIERADTMANTYAYTDQIMDDFDQRLASQGYIVGDDYSLADLTWTPILIRLQFALQHKIWGDGLRPNLERYFLERIRTRPGFKPAILDHYYNNVVPDGLAA